MGAVMVGEAQRQFFSWCYFGTPTYVIDGDFRTWNHVFKIAVVDCMIVHIENARTFPA